MIVAFLLSAQMLGTVAVETEVNASVQHSSTLCYPKIASDDLGSWHISDRLFKKGQYLAAARGYYQIFLCGEGGGPISPVVRDYNQLEPFDTALRTGASGNYLSAAAQLKHILHALPQFGEARFMMGIFQWSAGEHKQARETWRDTVTAPYFTLPPDAERPPFIVKEAQQFLVWSSSQN